MKSLLSKRSRSTTPPDSNGKSEQTESSTNGDKNSVSEFEESNSNQNATKPQTNEENKNERNSTTIKVTELQVPNSPSTVKNQIGKSNSSGSINSVINSLSSYSEEKLKRPDLKGYLQKKADKGPIKKWKRRFFLLEKGDILSYFESETSQRINYIPLREATSIEKDLANIDPFAFSIEIPGRSYILKASTQEEKSHWISTLNYIQRILEKEKIVNAIENKEDIIFDESDIKDPPQVKAATLQRLVDRLTDEHFSDPKYTQDFLLVYRSFTTGCELMDLLIERFRSTKQMKENTAVVIRFRIFNVVKTWITKHGYDFIEDMKLTRGALELKKTMSKEMKKQSDQIGQILEKLLREVKHLSYEKISMLASLYLLEKKIANQTPPPPLLPTNFDSMKESDFLFGIDPMEIARQMTLLEYSMYHLIQPKECLDQSWARKNKETKASNIMNMIRQFNQTSLWVATTVLQAEDLALRTKVMSQFISIAQKCRDLNNFNGIVEIISGLENASVHRLQNSWKNLQPNIREIFDKLRDLISSTHNFKSMRGALKTVNPPCCPYLGIFLTDLTFIEEGNPNLIEGLINFAKRKKIANVIREIQQYQQIPFVFGSVERIQTWLKESTVCEENELYRLSLLREPRTSH